MKVYLDNSPDSNYKKLTSPQKATTVTREGKVYTYLGSYAKTPTKQEEALLLKIGGWAATLFSFGLALLNRKIVYALKGKKIVNVYQSSSGKTTTKVKNAAQTHLGTSLTSPYKPDIATLKNQLEVHLKNHAPYNEAWRTTQLAFFDVVCQELIKKTYPDHKAWVQAVQHGMKTFGKPGASSPIASHVTQIKSQTQQTWALHHFADRLPYDLPKPIITPDKPPVSVTSPKASVSLDVSTGPKGVGSLGSKYPWASDHLPIAGSVKIGGQEVGFASYNIVHKNYTGFFQPTHNSQGLHGSEITQSNAKPSAKYPSLNLREEKTVDQILEIISHSRLPRAFMGLQECSKEVYLVLQSHLPPNYKIVWPDTHSADALPFIYNTDIFDLAPGSPTFERYLKDNGQQNKYIVDATLIHKASSNRIRFINTHVELGKGDQLAKYIANHPPGQGTPIVLMGDMNSTSATLNKTFQSELAAKGIQATCITECQATHVNGQKQAADYDQAYCIESSNGNTSVRATYQSADIFETGSEHFLTLEKTRNVLKENIK